MKKHIGIIVLSIVFLVLNVYAVNHFTAMRIVLIPTDHFYTIIILSVVLTTILVGMFVARMVIKEKRQYANIKKIS